MTAHDVTAQTFAELPLKAQLISALGGLGFEQMTQIQQACLPAVLSGQDVIGRAKTGSGKTAVFGLGLLQKLEVDRLQVQSLVLCPTRELAEQVASDIRKFATAMANTKLVVLCGGRPIGPQKVSLRHGAHIVVGTPGRVLDLLRRGALNLQHLTTLTLDEADRMLDMGFSEDVEEIVARSARSRQTLLFSATYPEAIVAMSRAVQVDPIMVSVDADHTPDVIEQLFYEVSKAQHSSTLLGLFEHYAPEQAVVFCTTRKQCSDVCRFLNENNVEAVALHGDLDQRRRDLMLALFANRSTAVLVATDVAARGLDIKALPAVINYELPHDPEVYVHRIGRTGRAGARGRALSLFTESQLKRLRAIESYTGEPCLIDVPASLDRSPGFELRAHMGTLQLDRGKKAKIRKGDLLGALTGEAGLDASAVGRIDLFDHYSLVALDRHVIRRALGYFSNGKVKGRSVRARRVS